MKIKLLVCSLLMTVVGIVACSQQDDAVSEKSKMKQDTDNSSCGFADPEMEKLNSSIMELQADVSAGKAAHNLLGNSFWGWVGTAIIGGGASAIKYFW